MGVDRRGRWLPRNILPLAGSEEWDMLINVRDVPVAYTDEAKAMGCEETGDWLDS